MKKLYLLILCLLITGPVGAPCSFNQASAFSPAIQAVVSSGAVVGTYYYSCAGTDTYATTDSPNNGFTYFNLVQVGKNGNATKIEYKIVTDDTTSDLKIALWSADGSTQLSTGCTVSHPIGTGWVSCTITPVAVTNGTSYLIGSVVSSLSGIESAQNANYDLLYQALDYSSFPVSPLNLSTAANRCNGFRIFVE